MPYRIFEDEEQSKLAMRRLHNQREEKKHYIVTLPCHRVSVEIPKSQSDTYIACSQCGKKYLLTHSAVRNKLYSDG